MSDAGDLKVPTAKAIRDLLADLIGRDVSVTPGEPTVIGPGSPGTAAVYVSDKLQMVALGVMDLPLTAFLGGALGLLPVGGVQDLLAEGEVSSGALDNVHEILNVASALFNTPGAPHVKLYSLVSPGDLPPTDVSTAMKLLGGRIDLKVDVPGYGSGSLSMMLTY